MIQIGIFTSQALLDKNDGIYDGPEMFKEGSAEVKLCYGMLLHSVASTLGWSGFHSSANSTLLRGKYAYDVSVLHQLHTCTVCCNFITEHRLEVHVMSFIWV
jgi:hypothetical protein